MGGHYGDGSPRTPRRQLVPQIMGCGWMVAMREINPSGGIFRGWPVLNDSGSPTPEEYRADSLERLAIGNPGWYLEYVEGDEETQRATR